MASKKIRLVLPNHPAVVVIGLLMTAGFSAGLYELVQQSTSADTLLKSHAFYTCIGFLLVALSMVFGMRGSVIDVKRNHLFRWWGLHLPYIFRLPIWFRYYPLDWFDQVFRGSESRTCSNSNGTSRSYTVYTLALRGEDHWVTIYMTLSEMRARRFGETVANFLGWGFEDKMRGMRHAGTLDDSVVDTLIKSGDVPENPGESPFEKLKIIREEDRTNLENHLPSHWTAWWIILIIANLGAIGYSIYLALKTWLPYLNDWWEKPHPGIMGYLSLSLLAVTVLYLISVILKPTKVETLSIDAEWIVIDFSCICFPLSKTRIRIDAVEELYIWGSKVHLLSDQQDLAFGWDLSFSEAQWVVALVIYEIYTRKGGPKTS